MNKQEARAFSGVSERTLQNLMAQRKIGFRRETGRSGQTVAFDRAELERFKADREKTVQQPAVQRMEKEEMQTGRVQNCRPLQPYRM